MSNAATVLEAALTQVNAGRPVALAVIVATRGSTPQPPGSMLCVSAEAGITGTLGGGCLEAEICRRAHALIPARRGAVFSLELDHDYGLDDGMICGGSMDVAVTVLAPGPDAAALGRCLAQLRRGERTALTIDVGHSEQPAAYCVAIESQPRLLIAGAGHISRVLAGFATQLGFRVSVVDDRPRYANAKRFPPPVELIVGDIGAKLRACPIDGNTYVVIVTRGHRHDERALAAVLDSPARYIGMIGSRRKVDVIFEDLRLAGAASDLLARAHAPIGVDIRAVTTEEIALSIAAELVSVRRADRGGCVSGPLPLGRTAP